MSQAARQPLQRQSSVKVDPNVVRREDLPGYEKMSERRAEGKLQEIRAGAQMSTEFKAIPKIRPCQDVLWAVLFIVVTGVLVFLTIFYSNKAFQVLQQDTTPAPTWATAAVQPRKIFATVAGSIIGCICSLITTLIFVWCSHHNSKAVVYTALYFGPCLSIAFGVGSIAITVQQGGELGLITGTIMIGFGLLGLACVSCCWARLIPFMIVLLSVVSEVIMQHACMFFVAFAGSIFGIAWCMGSGIAMTGVTISVGQSQHDDTQTGSQAEMYAVYFVSVLVLFWGVLTMKYTCHTIYSGVFARWYYRRDDGTPLVNSIKVGLTKSFGSCALGGLVVAIVRAFESLAKLLQRNSAEDGNVVCCVVLCLVHCVVKCIGDMMEYFNEWAFVQVAVRGVRFIDAVRITFSLLTLGNLNYVIRDLLLGSVVTLGAFASAIVAASGSFLAGWALDGVTMGGICAIIGWLCGMVIGTICLGIISSGVKTILVCWSDDPSRLHEHEKHSAVDTELVTRINNGYDQHWPGRRQNSGD